MAKNAMNKKMTEEEVLKKYTDRFAKMSDEERDYQLEELSKHLHNDKVALRYNQLRWDKFFENPEPANPEFEYEKDPEFRAAFLEFERIKYEKTIKPQLVEQELLIKRLEQQISVLKQMKGNENDKQ